MKPTDQVLKQRIILITAALALVGFALEIGPVGGIFPLALIGLAIELPALGFLPYLALAASAAVGLHLGEEEPRPKKGEEEGGEVGGISQGEIVRVRTRPELHQLRMFFTALGGYAALKAITLITMSLLAPRYIVTGGELFRAFGFGFVYVALGWFVMWQFLRWYAQRQQWVRLQEELIGGNVTKIVAVAIFARIVYNIITAILQGQITADTRMLLSALLHLALLAGAAILWRARPLTLRRTIIALLATGGVIIFLTVVLVIVERRYVGG